MTKRTFISQIPIRKGWSGDQKYCVTDESGAHFLLRVSPAGQYERKAAEFQYMKRVAALGIPMCMPLELYQCREGVCSLQSWIDGSDAEEVISTLPDAGIYAYGLEAGRILRTIHTLPAPADAEDWECRFNRKIDRKLEMYRTCPLKYEQGEVFVEFITQNRYLLKDRPQSYHHGDYHIGNMMIDRDGKLQIIDFDRCDFGDPWEEFNRIVWCAQKAPAFATGMVDGYFEEDSPPMEFWRLLALYIASNTLSSLPWAIPFGETEITTMRNQAAEVLAWYDGMRNPLPKWYDPKLKQTKPDKQ
ncbi:MAG: phosphotransferase [Clostridia bacterium]|nr:phosphotransferase [Clostridia bacterium]